MYYCVLRNFSRFYLRSILHIHKFVPYQTPIFPSLLITQSKYYRFWFIILHCYNNAIQRYLCIKNSAWKNSFQHDHSLVIQSSEIFWVCDYTQYNPTSVLRVIMWTIFSMIWNFTFKVLCGSFLQCICFL